jgi:hypothetical protein
VYLCITKHASRDKYVSVEVAYVKWVSLFLGNYSFFCKQIYSVAISFFKRIKLRDTHSRKGTLNLFEYLKSCSFNLRWSCVRATLYLLSQYEGQYNKQQHI